jgi:NAD(P)-dependent dehydrogenase (short-subunit alcohol dehydrogenase family)
MSEVPLAPADRRPRIVITGAASGIGRAAAERLAATRAQLILADNHSVALGNLARELGAQARFCDVASETSVTIFAADLLATFSTVHVLINAAGDGYVRTLGMVQVSRALMPALRAAEGARLILNVGPSAEVASSLFPSASSSDGFDRLSEALAEQLKGTSIGVETLVPPAAELEDDPDSNKEASRLMEIVRRHFPAAFDGSDAQPSS